MNEQMYFLIKLLHKECVNMYIDFYYTNTKEQLDDLDINDLLVGTKGIVWDYVDIDEWVVDDLFDITKEEYEARK